MARATRAWDTLTVADGVAVASSTGYLGCYSGSTGVATITGAGSQWTNGSYLYVGYYGGGTLTVTEGGAVSNTTGYLGSYSGSTARRRSPAPAPSGPIAVTSTSAILAAGR